ncbi:MAG: hypothetical protein H6981_09095 [Gammaproteobacteria bacterium]|nr:hypothetical protein [Gammaproteobacteria bacterium]MCP5136945.1 hypothetical protein [Gammaproteobacteria bacterium]
MKKLPTLLVSAALVAAIATPFAISASPNGEHGCAHQSSEKLSQALGLSPEQSTKVDEIFAAQKAKREAYRAEREAQREANHKEVMAQLGQVLSPEQLKQFEAMEAKRKEWREHRMEGRAKWREEHMDDRGERDHD